jgi:ubiquinone/menaquinone biosynthesis C-methylase UbiE
MSAMTLLKDKPYRGLLGMEGGIARWYANQRRSPEQLQECRRQAAQLTAGLGDGAEVLEIAPGPGYLAIEMARDGRLRVTGLDVSTTFVELATAAAREARVGVEFRTGDAANMPFGDGVFELAVSQAAFKNFSRPGRALAEIHRVLRPGGTAVIQDMNRDTTASAIAGEVRGMGLGPGSAAMTRVVLGQLRHRAYSPSQFERLVAESPFRTCEISTDGIGMEVRLRKG